MLQLLLKHTLRMHTRSMSLWVIRPWSNVRSPVLLLTLCQLLAGWKIMVLNTSQIISVFYFFPIRWDTQTVALYLDEFFFRSLILWIMNTTILMIISSTLVTQPMSQLRPNCTELRSMDYYHQIFCRFQKCKRKVPPPSPLSTQKSPSVAT